MNAFSPNNRRQLDNTAALFTQLRLAIQSARIAGVSDTQIAGIIERACKIPTDPRNFIEKDSSTYKLVCIAWKLRSQSLDSLLGVLED